MNWPTQQHVTVRCTHCAWTHEGELDAGRQAHETHRLEAHGLATKPVKHRKRVKAWTRDHKKLEENIEGARTQGAATWVNERRD